MIDPTAGRGLWVTGYSVSCISIGYVRGMYLYIFGAGAKLFAHPDGDTHSIHKNIDV